MLVLLLVHYQCKHSAKFTILIVYILYLSRKYLTYFRIPGSACVTIVRTADNRNGQLAVTFFVSFSRSVLDLNTAMTALQVDTNMFM